MTPGELFAKHFSFFGKDASAEADAVYHDDVVVDFPYAPQHHTQRLEGKAAVVRFCSRVGDFFEGIGGSVDLHMHLQRRRTYPGVVPLLHLDHIYYRGNIEVARVEQPRSRTALVASDHLPLVADLLVRP